MHVQSLGAPCYGRNLVPCFNSNWFLTEPGARLKNPPHNDEVKRVLVRTTFDIYIYIPTELFIGLSVQHFAHHWLLGDDTAYIHSRKTLRTLGLPPAWLGSGTPPWREAFDTVRG